MTQRNKRRFTALEVLSEIEKLNTMECNAMLLQDVVDRICFDGSRSRSLAVDGLRYCSMDDGMRSSSADDGMGYRLENHGMRKRSVADEMKDVLVDDRMVKPQRKRISAPETQTHRHVHTDTDTQAGARPRPRTRTRVRNFVAF